MSSAIGNYVHYSWANYLKSGTDRTRNKGHNKFDAWKSQRGDIIERAEKLAGSAFQQESQAIKDLEDSLNALMTPMSTASPNIANIQKKVDKTMYKEFEDALQKIDHGTGNVVFKNSGKDYIGKARSNNVEDVLKRIDRLENELIRQARSKTISKDIFDKVKEIKSVYQNSYNEIQRMMENSNMKASTALKRVGSKNKLKEYREALNEIIKEYAAFPDIFTQKGALFEHLIKYAPKVMDESADAAIGKVVGDITGKVAFDQSAFDSYFTDHQNISDVLTSTHVSQNKIDVIVEWEGKTLNISAKNVNLESNWIHIVSKSSLLYLLQDEDGQFVNHFLNIYATHRRVGSQSSLTASRSAMLEEIKLILLYKALTGDTYGKKAANLFIVNDNRTGTVKVYTISGIIEKAASSSIKGVQANGKTFNTSFRLKNSWSDESAQDRISKLLADAHAKKISVSLSGSLLK